MPVNTTNTARANANVVPVPVLNVGVRDTCLNVVAVAPTGTGKTLAFVIPLAATVLKELYRVRGAVG